MAPSALDLQKGKLAHIDLLNELANVGKFVGNGFKSPSSTGAEPFTDIVQLTGNFNVVNGLAQTNNVKMLIPGGSIGAEGAVNLATEELNMHLTAVLDKALSQQAGGTQIGGFMQTALANQQGELVIPILLTGTFSSPRVAPDVQKIAQMKLQNLLPTAGNPGCADQRHPGHPRRQGRRASTSSRAESAAFSAPSAGQQQQRQQQGQQPKQPVASPPQQPPQQQNPLGNILNQVLGGQQQQKQQPPPKQ